MVLKKIQKNGPRTYPELSLLCQFFEESQRFFKFFLQKSQTKFSMLKCFEEPRTGVSLILKFLKNPKPRL
jgi:hypothetical protein